MPISVTLSVELTVVPPPKVHEALHASVFEALKRVSPAEADAVHAPENRVKPFALEIVELRDSALTFRVHALRDGFGELFLQAWPLGSELTGRDGALLQGRVVGVRFQEWSYDALRESAEGYREKLRLALDFPVPAAFKHDEQVVCWPAPELMWGGLMVRWKAFGPALCDPFSVYEVRLTELRVRDARMELHREHGRVSVPGFVGRAVFEFRGSSMPAALALLRLAERAGVGVMTTYGFGRVQVSPYETARVRAEAKRFTPVVREALPVQQTEHPEGSG